MARTGGTRGSPRIHHDGPESFPLTPDNNADVQQVPGTRQIQQQPAALGLDATRLRRLSFGGRGVANKNRLPALDRPRAVPTGPLAPLPVEKPTFHHGDARPKLPKREKPQKRGKRGKRQSIGDEDFGQSALLDDELRGNVNARTIAAASMEMARSNPTQEGRQQRVDGSNQDGHEDSRLCQDLLSKAPHGHDDASKYWSRSLRLYAAQSHPEEFALIQLKLAQSFYATAMLGTATKEVLKSLDSCLNHYNICLQLYNPSRYPRRWGLAALEMGMALGLMADLVEREIPRVKPDAKAGTDAAAGFYKEVSIMTHKASDYRQRSLDNIESASEVLNGAKNTEERAKAQVEYARGILRRLTGDPGENRELAVFNLEKAIQDYEILIHDESLKNEGPDDPNGYIGRGPAHAYQLPVRVASRQPASNDPAVHGASKASGNPSSYDAEAEERLPMRLRGVKAAYGRALGTAGKLCLDKHASTIGGHPESAAQACDHLAKAAEVIPDDTRDRAEALLLLARATTEKCAVAGPNGFAGRPGSSPSEALETGIGHLRAALETCPQKQLALRQELHWNLGRLALARLQGRLRTASAVGENISGSSGGRTPLLYLAREAGKHLTEAVSLAQAALEVAVAVEAAEARPKRAAQGAAGAVVPGGDDDGMRAREGWARMELSKLCLTEVAPDYHVATAIEHLNLSREIYPLDAAPAEYITCTCLLARAFHQAGEPERSVQAYREAARAAPLLGNQLHHAHLDLNPGAIITGKEANRYGGDGASMLASPRKQPLGLSVGGGEAASFMPSLSLALRGLFGGGMARCFDGCREKAAHASIARRPSSRGATSESSFRTTTTSGGGSFASGAAATRSSSKRKRMAEWRWIPDQDRTPDNPRVKPPASINVDRKESKAGAPGIPAGAANPSSPQQTDAPYSAEELTRWKPGPLKELLAGLGLDASGCAEKKDVVEKIMRHPGGAAAAAAAATARGETIAVPGRGAQSPGQEEGGDGRSARSAEETTAAATAEKGGEEEEEDGFVGMTLADYMGRPTEENGGDHADFGAGGGRPGGGGPSDRGGGGGGGGPPGGGQGGGVRGRDGRGGGAGGDGEHGRLDRARPASISGSASGGRDELSSAASGRGGKVVRLAPAHIAPPSRPAPEWVVHMQKGRGSAPERKVVVNRPLPFSGVGSAATAASASCSGGEEPEKSRRRRRRRRHRSTSGADSHDDDDDDGGGGIVLAQAQAMQAFRFLCRSGQLFLAEQLALSGVWDAGKTESGGGVGGGEDRNTGYSAGDEKRDRSSPRGGEASREGLWTAWMATRLPPTARKTLKERRERVRLALEDVRRFARARGAIFLLPRVGVETAAAASGEWDLRAIPSQREVVREIRSFEKWLVRSGVWLAQPLLALLTTCGTTAPGGLKAGTGADGTGADIPVAFGGREHVAPSEYPTDEALAEMVDSYEALVCWFYLPDDGRSDSSSGGGSNSSNSENDGGGGGVGGRGYGSEIACFVAYRDEGTRRSDGVDDPAADNNGRDGEPGKDASRLADLEAKRAAIAARARDRRRRGVAGGSQRSGSSASGGSDDGSSDSDSDGGGEAVNDDELDAEDFDPGALRVRLLLASPGTTQQLRKATGAFLKAIGNRNPVKRNVLSAFALQDLSIALEVPKVLKALPPHVQEITVIQHGLIGVIPVHALPLEEVSSNGEPGRPRSRAAGRPPSAGAARGAIGGGGAGSVAPLAVLDSYSVRYTSSLYLLEIAERAAAASARDMPWYFNTCCVVEDPLRDVYLEDRSRDDKKTRRGSSAGRAGSGRGDDSSPRGRSAGLQHTQHEGRVVGAVWSSDPEECHFCKGESATRQTLTTVVVPRGGTGSHSRRGRGRGQSLGRGRGRGNTTGGAHATSNGPANSKGGGGLGNGPAIATPAEVAAEAAAETSRLFASKLNQARCLHLCCPAIHHPRPGLILCRTSFRESKRGGNGRKGLAKRLEEEHIDASSLLKQLHLRSCGLVVLSRGGLTDNMRGVEDAETRITAGQEARGEIRDEDDGPDAKEYDEPRRMTTPPLGLMEAFIAAGARTVVQKLWYDEETALVDTVTLLCFYEELKEATLAGEKRPVSVALREAQLWLRDATLTDILSRVQDAKGLPPDDSDALMKELSSLFKTMSERGNGAAIDRPFSSPYHWAGFQAMGSCGAVQSLQSLEAEDDDDEDDSDTERDVASRASKGASTAGRGARGANDGNAISSSSGGSSSESENDSSSSSSVERSKGDGIAFPVPGEGGGGGGKKRGGAGAKGGSGGGSGNPARERTGSGSSSGSSDSSSDSSGSSSDSESGGSSSGGGSSSNSSESGGTLDAGFGFSGSGGDDRSRRSNKAAAGKDSDVLNKTLKAVGSAYDMAGRLGGRFKARAAAAAAASSPSTRASAPPGAVDAAVAAAAVATGETAQKKPKSPHSWGSSNPAGLQRPGWSRKATRDARKTGEEPGPVATATAGSGNCVIS